MCKVVIFASLLAGSLYADSNSPLLLQKPSLSKTHIVFVYAGDLWTVPREGGDARRLTSGPSIETNPVFSPDGSSIAFTGEYDGNVDVYTVPAAGGVSKRLTWHPSADIVLGWSPDGKKVLFASDRESHAGVAELFAIDINGSFPEKIPPPWGWEAAYSPDGTRLAYVPMRRAFSAWKHYRGGDTTPIWLASLSQSKIEKVPRDNSNDYNPLWIGGKVYFLSDRNGPVTLFSYDTRSKQVKEEVSNSGLDFKSAGAGPDAIVIEQFGALSLFDIKSGKVKPVAVRIAGDLPEVRERMVNVGRRLGSAHLSPNAARALFEARGEIITVPAEKGDVRVITNTPKVMERSPAWSPDGKTIAYFSDEPGEYELHLAPQNGMGAAAKIPMPEAGSYRAPQWSPDSKKIAFVDARMRIWYVEVETKKTVMVDKERFWNPSGDWAPVWSPDVRIDFDNISQRILAMPLAPLRYVRLEVGKPGILFATEISPLIPGQPPALAVHRHNLKTRKTDVAAAGVQFFEVSQSGDKMLTRQGENWYIRNLPPPPPASGGPATPPPPMPPAAGPGSGQLSTANIEVRIRPREEWKQMYHEAWRTERDYFYDPGYHGLDLQAAEKRYEPFVDGIASRVDLSYLFSEMLGNMVVGHLGVFGGEQPEVKRIPTGLLGCDFKIENNRYRFARVYNGENWNPEAHAPLTQPGVNVVAQEYLLAVNGRNLTAADNVYSFFEGAAGKQVVIRVGADPSGANSREVTVIPVPNEGRLRNLAWIEDNRRKVDQLTGGRVAYVYLPDTAFGGFANFTRYFFAQVDKKAVIIDERFNGGGALATDIIEFLSRKLMSSVATRDGDDEVEPQGAIFGPKVMLINEFAGSGGDAMPWYFRRAGVGKLIGKRTWGGLVGRAYAPPLMDGGIVTAPSSGVWDPSRSEWIAENKGITPDIEVEHDPETVRQGHDPQLEKAIQEIMAELDKDPPKKLVRPKFPRYQTLR